MQPIQLTVEHRQAMDGGYCRIEGLPEVLFMVPEQIRTLARQLNEIANDGDQGAIGTITYPAKD